MIPQKGPSIEDSKKKGQNRIPSSEMGIKNNKINIPKTDKRNEFSLINTIILKLNETLCMISIKKIIENEYLKISLNQDVNS